MRQALGGLIVALGLAVSGTAAAAPEAWVLVSLRPEAATYADVGSRLIQADQVSVWTASLLPTSADLAGSTDRYAQTRVLFDFDCRRRAYRLRMMRFFTRAGGVIANTDAPFISEWRDSGPNTPAGQTLALVCSPAEIAQRETRTDLATLHAAYERALTMGFIR